ncbi:MAG: hypothetical protein WC842_04265 [Candidatus Paceibacterota bacterium]|jgi:hypothetical protein
MSLIAFIPHVISFIILIVFIIVFDDDQEKKGSVEMAVFLSMFFGLAVIFLRQHAVNEGAVLTGLFAAVTGAALVFWEASKAPRTYRAYLISLIAVSVGYAFWYGTGYELFHFVWGSSLVFFLTVIIF